MSVGSERRRSSLLSQLGRAQTKISTLEEFIRDRERQLHTAVTRLERTESVIASGRPRRNGLTHNMFGTDTLSCVDDSDDDLAALLAQPLREYVLLKITKVMEGSDPDQPVPFFLRRLVSTEYHIGPEGASIGSDSSATISLPSETGLLPNHLDIRWIPDAVDENVDDYVDARPIRRGSKLARQSATTTTYEPTGHFVLRDCTNGEGIFYLERSLLDVEYSPIMEQEEVNLDQDNGQSVPSNALLSLVTDAGKDTSRDSCHEPAITESSFCTHLNRGVCFVAGQLEFSLTALPVSLILTLQMFAAAKKGDTDNLMSILESSATAGVMSPHIVVTHTPKVDTNRYSTLSVVSDDGVDVNVMYQPPSRSEESVFSFGHGLGRRRSSATAVRLTVPMSPCSESPGLPHPVSLSKLPHRLLLHIAIENRDLRMVKYLLGKGADVNLCSGDLGQNALHLAALANLEEIMVELLRFGGDIDVRDSRNFQPLALTTSYNIRKVLLGTVLLCAASEAGDIDEVMRLVTTADISPNARGLRHKNALHLACARGHKEIVEFFLLNGAQVNAKGGTRQRTPLHYASLKNNVAVATLLLESGANEFARDVSGYTPLNLCLGGEMCKLLHNEPLSLCLAVQSGDLESVKRILVECEGSGESEGDGEKLVDQRNLQSHAPLHLACTTGNIAIARVLVAHGAYINLHGGSDSWTPLFYAALAGQEDVVEFLLSVGASTEEVDAREQTVQECVERAIEDSTESLKKLEKRGRAESVEDKNTLHTLKPAIMIRQESATSGSVEAEKAWLSTRRKQLKLVSNLLTSGPERLLKAMETKNLEEFVSLLESSSVDPNSLVDKYCPSSALVRVCEDGLVEFAKVLIKHGAIVNVSGPTSQIPLLAAAGTGQVDIVQLLVENGASVWTQSADSKNTALHEAASLNSIDTVQYLLTVPGVVIDAENSLGETPFDCCSLIELKKLLACGNSRLLMAAAIGDEVLIRQLVEEGISPSHEFKHGLTALHESCEGGHFPATNLLIQLGANVNKQTHISQVSPLHIASQNNFIDIAQVLIQGGAKLDIKDNDGKVPFEVASTNQMRKVLVEARSIRTQPIVLSREGSSGEKKCMICMDNAINTIILPCGHQAFCTSCVSRINICALDRQPIREVITVYK